VSLETFGDEFGEEEGQARDVAAGSGYGGDRSRKPIDPDGVMAPPDPSWPRHPEDLHVEVKGLAG
jgi:hypothetical protein